MVCDEVQGSMMEKTERLFLLVKNTIEQIEAGIRCVRKQNYYQFSIEEQQILTQVGEILPLCACLGLADVMEEIQQALMQIMNAKEGKDYILTADYYELLLLPVLKKILEIARQWERKEDYWEVNQAVLKKQYPKIYEEICQLDMEQLLSDGNYQLEDTMSGDKTLLVTGNRGKVYFHSNHNPKEEARQLAETYYEQCNTTYHVLGLGLGYLPEALLAMDTSSHFVIYENDFKVIRLMLQCRDCRTLLESARIELVYDKNYHMFLKALKDGHTIFHEPSLHNIQDKEEFAKFYGYFMTIQSAVNQRRGMQENFLCNMLHQDESVEVLEKEFAGKTVYLVAGGPSLDKTIECLKEKSKAAKIVCVGTSVKKLKAAGILPDYMIVTDPMPWMKEQVEGSENIPLWYLSTASYEVRNRVKQGYLILQKGYDLAEEYGNKKGRHLYETGGSVTTTALDVLLSMKCLKIICVGMDMAYTDNKSHADGTSMARSIGEAQNRELIQRKGVKGDTVYAPKNLDLYRRWIEKRIEKEHTIELMNVSDGALVKGMKNIPTNIWRENQRG